MVFANPVFEQNDFDTTSRLLQNRVRTPGRDHNPMLNTLSDTQNTPDRCVASSDAPENVPEDPRDCEQFANPSITAACWR
jgi:hypothetical protein